MFRRRKQGISGRSPVRPGRLMHRAVSYLLCLFLALQPLMLQAQEITAAQSAAAANRPDVGTAGNGVPLVNIVAPNTAGLSHNKYDRFGVGRQGAILNNSDQSLQRSQLGGLVYGNPNLNDSGTASVILNEVVSSSRSLLEGSLEVHGDSANVIVANPNGVTCDGCGFINTPRATLSTGRPELDGDGSLGSFQVEDGDINIGSNGTGLDGISAFDLLTRRIRIEGTVEGADDLSLVVGRNSYAYQSGLVAPFVSDSGEHGVAIDSSLISGMYAGQIKIISTERGSGVNMQGQMAASAHDMIITADGKLLVRNARAREGITATSESDSVQVAGTLFSEEGIVLEGERGISLDDNALVAASGDVSLKAETVALGDDALVASGASEGGAQAPVGSLSVEANRLDAGSGQLAAGDLLTVAAPVINLDRAADDNTDVLRSLGRIALETENISAQNARVSAMDDLDLKSSASLELAGGLYSTAGSLLVEAADVTTGAALNAADTAAVRGTSGGVVNSGRIAGDEGTIVSAATTLRNEGDLFSLKSVGIASLQGTANTAAGRIAGNEGVALDVASLDNKGKVAAQESELTVNTGGSLDNAGELSGASARLNVDGTLANSGRLDVAGALAIKGHNNAHSAALNNNSGGAISSGSGHYSTNSFNNAASLKTRAAELEIDVAGNMTNTGAIEAKTTGTINLDGDLDNSGSIVSEKALRIAGRSGGGLGTLSNTRNTALINGGESLGIKAGAVANAGEIGSADGSLSAEVAGDIRNTGVLYSGTSSVYALDGGLTNAGADILAEDNLSVGGLSSARAASIRNSSGSMEAIAGDLTLMADAIANERAGIAFGTSSTTQTSESGNTTTTVVTTRDIVSESSAASKLLAGGNITIGANTLDNSYSQIAANGDIAITANTASNIGRDLIETVETTTETHHSRTYCSTEVWGVCFNEKTDHWTTTENETASSTYDSEFASMQAGGTLNATVGGYLSNNAVRGSAGQIGLASGSRALDSASVAGGGGPGDLVSLGELDVAIDALLGRGALFDVAGEPSTPFLVETRSSFINPNEFLGSDFFLSQIGGYNPDQTLRRFGDAYVETRIIFDQIFALSGQRYLGSAADSRSVVQSLYENAIDAQQALGLAFGIALTPSQIARLTQDITWLEERVVRGEAVLVPRVYLASVTRENINVAGAQIRAGQTNIQAATLASSGDITGDGGLNVAAADAVLNQGGGLFSNADIIISGGRLFANTSGRVSGDNVAIAADDILNDTAKTRDRRSNGFTDRQQQIARIQARGDLALEAGRSIASTGGQLDAGGSILLDAGQAVELGALEIERLARDEFSGGYNRESLLVNRLAGVDAGAELAINAGGDVILIGTRASSGGDTRITAAQDVSIAAVQDRQSRDFKLHAKTGGLFGTETNIREQSASTETRGSDIEAGGALVITSESENIAIDASRLASREETTLNVEEGKIALLTNTDVDYEQREIREEDALWWNESNEGHYRETIRHVEIEADGGLRINVGEDIVVHYEKTGDLNASLDQLARSPGLEWVGQLRDDPRVNWVEVEARFDEWDYEHQGLTEAGAAVVSLVVVAVSGGALSSLSATLAQGLGFAADGAIQAALQAGLGSLANQASVALVNTQGDIGATLDVLGSSASVRSLAAAMVAAGLTAHVGDAAGIGADLPKTAPLPDRVAQDIRRNLIRASVNASVSTAIEGGEIDENLVSALRREAASVIGENAAQEIGRAFHSGEIDRFAQLVAHAAVGCVGGAVASGECGSGAFGAVVGEAAAEIQAQRIQERLSRELADGSITREEALAMAEDMRDSGVDIARLASGLSAALVGADVDAAADAGEAAAENNAFWIPVIIAVATVLLETADKALLAKDALDITRALAGCDQGSQSACDQARELAQQAAMDVGMELSVGHFVPGSKAATELYRWVRKHVGKDAVHAIDNLAEAIQHNVPKGYTVRQNDDSSVTVIGPNNGRYEWLGEVDPSGRPIYFQNGKRFTLDGGRKSARAPPGVQIHHICTRCNQRFSKAFQKILKSVDLGFNDRVNLVAVLNHRGPHPDLYHQYVLNELNKAIGKGGDRKKAIVDALGKIKKKINSNDSQMRLWLTKPKE